MMAKFNALIYFFLIILPYGINLYIEVLIYRSPTICSPLGTMVGAN